MKLLNKKNLNYLIYMVSVILLIFIAFNTYITFQIHSQLAKMTSKPARWPVGAYIYDSKIGFDFAPDVSGPIQDSSFYTKSHHLGYRISEYDDGKSLQPGGVLSLGCSFTYGDEVESEQTFTQVIADSLGIPAYNYGVSSFSYAHALVKGQNLKEKGVLEKLQPQYVILGCWKDLPDRTRTPFPRLASKSIPLTAAYFGKDGNDVKIEYPLSSRHIFELVTMYRKEGPGLSLKKFNKIFFAVPRFVFIYLKNSSLSQKVREIKPNSRLTDFEIYNFYFTNIEAVFSSYRSKIIVLFLTMSPEDKPGEGLMKAIAAHPDIIFVDGRQAIKNYNVPLKDYKGKHPQPAAHKAYGLETATKIDALETK